MGCFYFYNNSPVNQIPQGFIPFEDYNPDETTTTDLESTSVETTQVTDNVVDKKTLEDMVEAKKIETAQKFNDDLKKYMADPVQYQTNLVDMYRTLQNQQTLATGLGVFTGGLSLLTKPFIANKQADLEKALVTAYGSDWKNNEIFKNIDNMTFTDKITSAFSALKAAFTTDDDTPYEAQYDTANHPLGGGSSSQYGINEEYGGAFGMLSPAEQRHFDSAVRMGLTNVANHYAIINHHRQIQLDSGTLSDGAIVALAGTETPSESDSGSGSSGSTPTPIPGTTGSSYTPSGVSTTTQTIQDSIEAAALADTIDADAGSTETTSGSLTAPGELV